MCPIGQQIIPVLSYPVFNVIYIVIEGFQAFTFYYFRVSLKRDYYMTFA